jgi:CheY-like chemotaxis protein
MTLSHLYDPEALRGNPLAHALGVAERENTPTLLRQRLTEKVEALRPDSRVPAGSKAWRVYHILHYRYVEQLTQREVAADIAISVRQLRRQETMALRVLADSLWDEWALGGAFQPLTTQSPVGGDQSRAATGGVPDRQQELEYLRSSIPSEQVPVAQLLSSVLGTLGPLIEESGGEVSCSFPNDLPPLTVQLTTMRQAVLNILVAALRRVPGGKITVGAETNEGKVHLHVRATGEQDVRSSVAGQAADGLEMAKQLVQISGGRLDTRSHNGTMDLFAANLVLPAAQQVPVLAIDDNADTLRLLHRCLSGTRYRLTSSHDPGAAIRLARQVAPRAILLDVMFPEFDGWELLGRLREHPQTHGIPVIVCTILPHDDLAKLLGAAEFIRKPFSQQRLLSVLDRLSGLSAKECS